MKLNYPGLLIEKNRSGSVRYRVRMSGNKQRRTAIPVPPEHPDFMNYYWAGRVGKVWEPEEVKDHVKRSIDWLVNGYVEHLSRLVKAQLASPLTLKQRKSQLKRVCEYSDDLGRYGDFDMAAPTAAFIRLRDSLAATPAEADNVMKSVRAMYAWAMEREEIDYNPAAGIAKIHISRGGAVAWTAEDLKRFREHHPLGTMAHLWLTLQMFTACRISDAIWLGPECEILRDGQIWIEWTPKKKGSAPVSLPMMAPLFKASRAMEIKGRAYLLAESGKPFSSPEALRNRVNKWCATAGIEGKSSHGIRKAVAELLAEAGATQHQIMAIMAHTQAKTSEVYTRGAQRRILSLDAMQVLGALDW